MKPLNNTLVHVLQFILPRQFWYRRFYLRSRHWREISKLKKEFMKYRCEVCKRRQYNPEWYVTLDVYNLTCAHIWDERLSDLQVLCRQCHERIHA